MKGAADARRLPHIDLLKVVASQLIVLHHFALYGPMADLASPLMPEVMAWFADTARIAVQVFLVTGGYLAACSLAPQGVLRWPAQPATRLADRYLRLVGPLAAALVLAVVAAHLARDWLGDHPTVPAPATLAQGAWHLLLLQDVVGVDALSAGVWYVAIDFQLYALLLGWLALCAAGARWSAMARGLTPWGVALGVAWSAWSFNRDPDLDRWAWYFLAAHGLGALAAWAHVGWSSRGAFFAALTAVLASLAFAFRDRLALAAAVAVGLWWWHGAPPRWLEAGTAIGERVQRGVAALAQHSYALFLVHFPVGLVVNAGFNAFLPSSAGVQMVGIVVAWGASMAASVVLYRGIEQPLNLALNRRRARFADQGGRGRNASAGVSAPI